ncbi:diguanylate cyclase domain-containing protein [Ilumatobacter coccineus]|uniref:GGDEF domain-containing protein n=1 Tax=Ilumatobacter coccineus (strain NBRC 103263 / KCTC 29153 / YM16-304) TaxID=1313172 RepID=A0A6C7EC29_ILUCY|nr:diguanylate cyclase [Ilumatobacter coccineus]BAN02749.1 hypothetical protein YM304_24350 [Ilumatobacter coccineus YM16-304]
MTRRTKRIDDAVVRSLSHMRVVLALALALFGAVHLVRGERLGSVAVAAAVLVGVSALAEPRLRRRVDPVRLSIGVVVLDLVVTIAALGVNGVEPGDPTSLALAIPLVLAGIRHGLLGAIATGISTALALFAQLALTWDGTPGQADDPLVLAAVLMAVAVPTARLAEHVTARLRLAETTRARAQRRSHALELVTHAGAQLLAADPVEHDRLLVAAAEKFVGVSATIEHSDGNRADESDTAADDDATIVRLDLDEASGGRLVLTGAEHALDDLTVDALELLVAMSRAQAGATRRAAPAEQTAERHSRHLSTRSETLSWLDDRLRRDPAELTLGIVSLDNLKLLNDLHGHDAGDALIEATIERLLQIDPSATVGRLVGGDFVVAIDTLDVDRPTIAEALAGDVSLGRSGSTRIYCGVGLAAAGTDRSESGEQLLRRAMSDMYADKRAQNAAFLAAAASELDDTATDTTTDAVR